MAQGARITDAVSYWYRRGDMPRAVKLVRRRAPERFRWKTAVSTVNYAAGSVLGLDRMRIEEPIRELVLDLDDTVLQREVILDARRYGVDLDRGEVLPYRTHWDVRRLTYLAGVDVRHISNATDLPIDFDEPVDTAAVAVVGRWMAQGHRLRAQRVWLELPDPDGPDGWLREHHMLARRAKQDQRAAERWAAFTRAILEPEPEVAVESPLVISASTESSEG